MIDFDEEIRTLRLRLAEQDKKLEVEASRFKTLERDRDEAWRQLRAAKAKLEAAEKRAEAAEKEQPWCASCHDPGCSYPVMSRELAERLNEDIAEMQRLKDCAEKAEADKVLVYKEVTALCAQLSVERDSAVARADALLKAVEWMSGSNDFAPRRLCARRLREVCATAVEMSSREKRRIMRRLRKKRLICALCTDPATREVIDEQGRTLRVCERHYGEQAS